MINRCLIIFMELSFLGCAYKSNREIMNSWMGSHISAVIRSWGPPTQITSDGAGGKIYIRRPQPIQLPPEPPPAPQEQVLLTNVKLPKNNLMQLIDGLRFKPIITVTRCSTCVLMVSFTIGVHDKNKHVMKAATPNRN